MTLHTDIDRAFCPSLWIWSLYERTFPQVNFPIRIKSKIRDGSISIRLAPSISMSLPRASLQVSPSASFNVPLPLPSYLFSLNETRKSLCRFSLSSENVSSRGCLCSCSLLLLCLCLSFSFFFISLRSISLFLSIVKRARVVVHGPATYRLHAPSRKKRVRASSKLLIVSRFTSISKKFDLSIISKIFSEIIFLERKKRK